MSLDISLEMDPCPYCGRGSEEVFSSNITHNLGAMWREAGCYEALYESHGRRAKVYIAVLDRAVALMEADPPRFEKHNAPNGWGLYKHAFPWLREVRNAFRRHPNATIRVSQ